jgi:hypothetical protein
VSEANDSATVSEANESATVSEANESSESTTATTDSKHESHIEVLRGNPTDLDVAALVAVLGAASSVPSEPREQEENLWGHPVDRLRYTTFSWQRVTLLERTHMRHR